MTETETSLYATGSWGCIREALPPGELTVFGLGAGLLHPDPWQTGVQMLIEHEINVGRAVEYVDHHPEQRNVARLEAEHAPARVAVDPRSGLRFLTFSESGAGSDSKSPDRSPASRRRVRPLRVHDFVDGLLGGDVEGCRRVFGGLAASARADGTTSVAVVHSDDDDLVWRWRQGSGDRFTRLWQEWTGYTGFEEDAWTSAAVVNFVPRGGAAWGGMAVALADNPGSGARPAVETSQHGARCEPSD